MYTTMFAQHKRFPSGGYEVAIEIPPVYIWYFGVLYGNEVK